MRAAVLTAYGPADGLEIREVDPPVPGPRELLVEVHHATVTMGDTELRRSRLPWLFRIPLRLWLGAWRPRPGLVLGMEVAGTVKARGEEVDGFEPGEQVFGMTRMGLGGQAELACLSIDDPVRRVPADVALDQAVALPVGALEAFGYLRRAGIARGQRVLVRGASGSIGSYAVQLAKHHFGAHVTGVCGAIGVDRVRALGADVVLDYEQRDFWQTGERWDLMIDIVGRLPFARCLRVLEPGGVYVRTTVFGLGELLRAGLWRLVSRRRILLGGGEGTASDLALLAELLQKGVIHTVIDRRYPLDEIRDAHRYVETGHKQGNVLIDIA